MTAETTRIWMLENRERWNEYQRNWYRRNKDKFREYQLRSKMKCRAPDAMEPAAQAGN